MFAYEIPGLRFSLPAGAAIARRRFVAVNSSSAAVYPSVGAASIGVSMNQAASGEVLTIADGILMVEAAAAIAAGASIQVGADGKAITRTTGVSVGIAITAATGAGQLVAVRVFSANNVLTQTFMYTSADLAAGADIADAIIGVVPAGYAAIAVDAQVLSTGDAAGIDAANTSVVMLEVGSTKFAEHTYDATHAFPAAGASTSLTLIPAAVGLAAGSVILLTVTNGATANLPVFMVQLTLILTPAA